MKDTEITNKEGRQMGELSKKDLVDGCKDILAEGFIELYGTIPSATEVEKLQTPLSRNFILYLKSVEDAVGEILNKKGGEK